MYENMKIMKEILDRRSVRKYLNKEITKEEILLVLEAARLAPSGSNTQPWRFVVVTSQDTKEKIVQVDHNQKWMLDAPVFIVCVADISCRIPDSDGLLMDETQSCYELKQIIRDTAIAIENILLQATHMGLASCWTGWYEQNEMKTVLNIPSDKYVVGIVTLGYAAEEQALRKRKKLDEIVSFEHWEFDKRRDFINNQ